MIMFKTMSCDLDLTIPTLERVWTKDSLTRWFINMITGYNITVLIIFIRKTPINNVKRARFCFEISLALSIKLLFAS